MKILITYILIGLLHSNCNTTYQTSNLDVNPDQSSAIALGSILPAEQGKCYAKCKIKSTDELVEWREVVCANQITPSLIKQIKTALHELDYAVETEKKAISYYKRKRQKESKYELDEATKSALVSFQKDHGLPIGQLDFETLQKLGISL